MVGVAAEYSGGPSASHLKRFLEQKGYYNFCPGETWTPSVNLYEDADFYLVCVDLAGVDKAKIDIEVIDHRLTITGTRQTPIYQPEVPSADGNPRKLRVHLMEIDHGAFKREVELPVDVSREKISAVHRNGLLWIELPKN